MCSFATVGTDHTENTACIVEDACLLFRYLAIDVLLFRAIASAEICLASRCLAMSVHVTTLTSVELLVLDNIKLENVYGSKMSWIN
jgi:hypothetical protein